MRKLGAIGFAALMLSLMLIYGGLYLTDRAYDRGDYAFSLWIYKPLAILGINRYQTRVGHMYLSGRGVSEDYSEAAKWYLEPAENGDARAQFGLAILYLTDTEGLDDHEKAFEWCLRSASQGFKHAQAMVASMYSSGDGVAQDKVQAYKWVIISMDGELPKDFPNMVPKSFTDGVTPEQIAEAQRLAQQWMAKDGKKQ